MLHEAEEYENIIAHYFVQFSKILELTPHECDSQGTDRIGTIISDKGLSFQDKFVR